MRLIMDIIDTATSNPYDVAELASAWDAGYQAGFNQRSYPYSLGGVDPIVYKEGYDAAVRDVMGE